MVICVYVINLGKNMDWQRYHQHRHHCQANDDMTKPLQQDVEGDTHEYVMVRDAELCQSLPKSWSPQDGH